MEIFFIKKEEFLEHIEKTSIPKIYNSEKRNTEYFLSRLLVKYVASKIYGFIDVEIETTDNKPKFKNQNLNFSISHSKNMVATAFSKLPIGFDTEKIQKRNLEKLSCYFKTNFKTETDFYKFWTQYEACYKSKIENITQTFIFEDYMMSVSQNEYEDFEIYEIKNNSNLIFDKDKDKLDFEICKIDKKRLTLL